MKSGSLLFTEYEINDVPQSIRNLLTKGQTQDEICKCSGASISTRGRFIADKTRAPGDRPLYLFIQGSKQSLDLAVKKIEEIIQSDPPLATGSSSFRMAKYVNHNSNMIVSNSANGQILAIPPPPPTQQPPPQITTSTVTTTTTTTCVEKIIIGLDHAPPTFNLRGRLIGTDGANLNYIRNETGAMATLRGRGSLFIDPHLGHESQEPMHLFIEHLVIDGLQAAKQLAKNLIETVQQELVQFQQMNPPVPSIQYSTQTTVVQSIGVPPPMLAVPPPILQQAPPPPTVIQQPSFIQQTSAPPPITATSQHQVMPQTLPPMQIHHQAPAMQLQSTTINNVNLPPPGVHIPLKAGQLVQLPPPPPPHLSQPPPNLQLQAQPQTQIVLNQAAPPQAPPPNYQYQFIQTQEAQPQPPAGPPPPNHVTIQHIYQQPQPMQPLIQSQPPQQQFDPFLRPQQQQPQYILQSNPAFMVPPPNIIQSTAAPPPTHSMVFSAQPQPQQIHPANPEMQAITSSHQLITMHQPPPSMQATQTHLEEVKMEKLVDDGQQKVENIKLEVDGTNQSLELQAMQQHQQRTAIQPIVSTITSMSMCQAPPPIISVPPPGVQHITYLTSSQPSTHHQPPAPQQVFGQVPVSIHQIHHQPHPHPTVAHHHSQPPPTPHQTIMVPTSQQHILVNHHSWQPQAQPMQSLAPMQISHQQPMPILSSSGGTGGTYQQIQHPIMTTTTINPMAGMLQFQPPPPPQPQPSGPPHLMQSGGVHIEQLMPTALQAAPPPPASQFNPMQQLVESSNTSALINVSNGLGVGLTQMKMPSPQPVPYPSQHVITSAAPEAPPPRLGQKRKIEDDEPSLIHSQPTRLGMGSSGNNSNTGGTNFPPMINQRKIPTSQQQQQPHNQQQKHLRHEGGAELATTTASSLAGTTTSASGQQRSLKENNHKNTNFNSITSSADNPAMATTSIHTTIATTSTSSNPHSADENELSDRPHNVPNPGLAMVNQQPLMGEGVPVYPEGSSFLNDPPPQGVVLAGGGHLFADTSMGVRQQPAIYQTSNGYVTQQQAMLQPEMGSIPSSSYQPIIQCNILGGKPPPPPPPPQQQQQPQQLTLCGGYGAPQQQQRFRTQW